MVALDFPVLAMTRSTSPRRLRTSPEPIYRVETYETESGIGYLLGRCVSRVGDCVDAALAPFDLNGQQFGVLHAVLRKRARTPTDLARVHFKYSGAVTYVLDGLERKQLLVRQRSAEDRRVVELRLTAEGEALTRQCIPVVVEAQNTLLQDIGQDEYQALSALLRRIADGTAEG
jgi:DNA-binding MarR family transcriptional regulator